MSDTPDTPRMSTLKAWMLLSSPVEQKRLAKLAGTSRQYLYMLANPNASYSRNASPELAARIEKAVIEINRDNPHLPRVLRTDINASCRACEFARKCLGEDVVDEGAKGFNPDA